MKLPELLAPAGSKEALMAAVENGANAVYFGATAFNARMSAKNFTRDEAESAIAYCHEHGVACHVTMNTLVTDRQMKDALNQAEFLYRAGADALIVADLGLAALIHRYLPDMELHASTQCSAHNSDAARFLADMGFSRVVAAREVDRDNLRSICENSPIPVEMFIHGALCVSQSGQCLMSSFLGGRSGNRGECAQPCRMCYNGRYPLSLKDLCLAGHIREILTLGVASLKIEGRMKSPDYVGRVTAVYRRLLDEGRNATAEEMRYLSEVFSRSGFTDGYFTKTIGPSMLGVRTQQNKDASAELNKMAVKPTVKTQSKAPQSAPRPAILPKERSHCLPEILPKAPLSPRNNQKVVDSARFYDPAALPKDPARWGLGITYLPLDRFCDSGGKKTAAAASGVILPSVIFDSERETVLAALKKAKSLGAVHALVGNVGALSLCREAGLVPHGDYRLNITSSYTAALWEEHLSDMILSPELILPQIRDIKTNKSVIVYGRQPLMTLEKPVGAPTLTDRTRAVFPLLKEGRREILINALPTYMADKREELAKIGPFARHYIFTVEGKNETESILEAYRKGLPTKKAVRRIK